MAHDRIHEQDQVGITKKTGRQARQPPPKSLQTTNFSQASFSSVFFSSLEFFNYIFSSGFDAPYWLFLNSFIHAKLPRLSFSLFFQGNGKLCPSEVIQALPFERHLQLHPSLALAKYRGAPSQGLLQGLCTQFPYP